MGSDEPNISEANTEDNKIETKNQVGKTKKPEKEENTEAISERQQISMYLSDKQYSNLQKKIKKLEIEFIDSDIELTKNYHIYPALIETSLSNMEDLKDNLEKRIKKHGN